MLTSYAARSPDCLLDVAVHVLVVVKRMVMGKLFGETCMNSDYSPEAEWSQEFCNVSSAKCAVAVAFYKGQAKRCEVFAGYGLSSTTPRTVPGMLGGTAVVLTAFVVISKISTLPPSTT